MAMALSPPGNPSSFPTSWFFLYTGMALTGYAAFCGLSVLVDLQWLVKLGWLGHFGVPSMG